MTDMTLDRLTQLLNNIQLCNKERDWNQFHSPKNLAMNLQIESADLAEHFVWLTEEQSHYLTPNDKQNVANELGGVFMTLLLLSDKLGVNLLDAASQKLENIKQKHPVVLSKNKAIKQTELA